MNGNFSPEEIALAISIGKVCYGQSGSDQPLTLAQVYEALPGVPQAQIDPMLQRLNGCRLLSLAIVGGTVHATPKGKEAYEINAIAELAFGEAYIAHRYRSAVVHIVVHNPADGQESGGTGFFTDQPANRIVTAKHVVQGRTIVRIEDADGALITNNVGAIQLGAGTLDFGVDRMSTSCGSLPAPN
jgi:S1-C subfamily serine protease